MSKKIILEMSATETSFVLTNPETRIFSRTEGVYFIRLTLDDWWKSGGNTVELAMQKDTSARFVSYDVEKYSASGVAIPSTFLEDAGKIKVWIGQSKEGETRISSTAELTVEDSTGRPDGVTIAVKTPAGSDEGCIEKIRESGGQFQFYGTQGWKNIKTSDETDTALNGKVDKVEGKGLSTNDYTNEEKAEVAKVSGKVDKVSGKGLSTNDYTDSAKSFLEETVPEQIDRIDAKIAEVEANVYSNFKNKVDKVAGKGLSTNDFTTELKDKLDGVEAGANKTVVDAELSSTSENPVRNKAVKAALANKAGAEQLEKVINACCDVKTVSGGNYNLMKVSEVSFSSRLQDNVEGIVSSTAANFVTGWIPVTYGKYYAFSIKANGERTTYPNAPLIQRINAKKSDGTILVYNKYPEIVYNKNNQVAIGVPTDVVEMMIHINATVVTDVSTAEKLKVIEPMVVEGKTADEARTNATTKTYVDGDAVVPSELAYTLKHDDTKADKEQTSPYRRSVNWGVIPSAYYKGVNSQYATTFAKNTTYATFIAAWKTLVASHSGYVTETTLGQASDEQNIYLYDFKPAKLSNQKNAIPKIIIVAGQHGFEKSNIYGLYCFVDNLLNRWRQHSVLEYLRNHVELMIIPVLNTYGFDHLTYKNGNGVNLNRNYDSHWQLNADPTSEQYGGAAPFDQPETQIVRTLLQGNTDASLVIDFHTNGSSSVAQYSYINYYGVCQSTDAYYNRLLDAVAYQLSSISANFNVDYELNQPNTILGFLNNSAGIGLLRDWATDNNFAGMLLEGFNGFPNDAEFTEDVYKANEEILVNWLITASNYLRW